jgi:hypothetical protein
MIPVTWEGKPEGAYAVLPDRESGPVYQVSLLEWLAAREERALKALCRAAVWVEGSKVGARAWHGGSG